MSKLATFRIDEKEWKAFLTKAEEMGKSASALLSEFVKWINAGNTLAMNETVSVSKDISKEVYIEEKIEKRFSLLESKLYNRLEKLEQQVGESAA